MPRRKTESNPAPIAEPPPSADDIRELTRAVEELARQTRLLGQILDDVREDIIHAVRNGTFSCSGRRDEWRPVVTPSPLIEARSDRTPTAKIPYAATESPPPTSPPAQPASATTGQRKLFS